MGLRQGSAASTMRIVILNVIASIEQHSCNVVQLGQEALCSHCLQKIHSDNNGHWAWKEAYRAYDNDYLCFPRNGGKKIWEIVSKVWVYLGWLFLKWAAGSYIVFWRQAHCNTPQLFSIFRKNKINTQRYQKYSSVSLKLPLDDMNLRVFYSTLEIFSLRVWLWLVDVSPITALTDNIGYQNAIKCESLILAICI